MFPCRWCSSAPSRRPRLTTVVSGTPGIYCRGEVITPGRRGDHPSPPDPTRKASNRCPLRPTRRPTREYILEGPKETSSARLRQGAAAAVEHRARYSRGPGGRPPDHPARGLDDTRPRADGPKPTKENHVMTCTAKCAVPVPCPTCGCDLPPAGRSVPLGWPLASCCDKYRHDSTVNTRHVWSADEFTERGPR